MTKGNTQRNDLLQLLDMSASHDSVPGIYTDLWTGYKREQVHHGKGQDWMEVVMNDLLDRPALSDRHIQAVPMHLEGSFDRAVSWGESEDAICSIHPWPDQC